MNKAESNGPRPDASEVAAPKPAPRTVPFGEALRFWLKLGLISFGGPAGQIAIMHRELVERRRWISEARFLHALNYCMLLPGPEAQQLATYVGWLLHKVRGGLVAGGLFVLPSVFVLSGLSWAYAAHGETPAVSGVLYGLRPVVVAIVCEAVLRIGGKAIRRSAHFGIAVAAFLSIYWLGVPFPWIVLSAALVGWLGVRWAPSMFSSTTTPAPKPGSGSQRSVELVIDDDSPPSEHTRPSWPTFARVLLIGAALWVGGLLAVGAAWGFDSLYAEQYSFFTKAALVTFGGAYAVLAYVAQEAVGSLGWLTQAQTVDGLALAETTPGPLIMVVQFVGFMAGWNHPGALSPLASGLIGALLTTFVTFLPCFLFIFLGAPFIEVLRAHRGLAAALAGVTAAVVGVILNLALVFGTAVLAPAGWSGGVDWLAVVAVGVAFVALWRFRAEVLWVVLVGGFLGLLYGLVTG